MYWKKYNNDLNAFNVSKKALILFVNMNRLFILMI